MTLKQHLENFIKFFDLYSVPIKIYFKNKRRNRSFYGGIFSIFIFFLIFLISLYLLYDLGSKNVSQIIPNKKKFIDNPDIKVSLDYKDFLNFFFFAFTFYEGDEIIDIELFKNYLDLDARLMSYVKIPPKNDTQEITLKSFKLINCNETSYFKDVYENVLSNNNNRKTTKPIPANKNNTSKKKNRLNFEEIIEINIDSILSYFENSFCLEDNNFLVKGEFVSDNFTFFSLKIKNCNPNNNVFCYNKNQISNFVKNIRVDVNYIKYYFDEKIINKIPIVYQFDFIEKQLNSLFYQKVDFYLSKNNYISEENLFLHFFDKINEYFIAFNKFIFNYATISTTYYAFYIRFDKDSTEYKRNYKQFFDVVSQIGGIWKFIFIIFSLIVVPINLKIMYIKIANSIFNTVPPEKLYSLQNETYEHYSKLGSFGQINEVISCNNKNIAEAQMSIDIYKYQRHCDIDYSVEQEILQKISCFSKNQNEERIKNLKFMDYLYSRVYEKLDYIKILRFCKNLNFCMKLYLNRKSFLVDYYQISNDIDYKYISKIIKELNFQKMKSSEKTPIDVLENNFVQGMRYIKNKPIIDRNIDRKLLLRLFNEEISNDNRFVKNKYFKNYYKKFHSISDISSNSSSRIGLLININKKTNIK